MLVEVKQFAIILIAYIKFLKALNRFGINFTDYDEVKFVILIFTVLRYAQQKNVL